MGLWGVPTTPTLFLYTMLEIHLYNYDGLPNVLNKTLNDPVKVRGVFHASANVLQPVVKLQGVTTPFNYVKIPSLNRWYFVDNKTVEDTNFTTVKLRVDVLQTYKDSILKAIATSVRSDTPNYINNNAPVYDIRPNTTQLMFEDKLNHTGKIIMVTIKGT